jgi:nitrilase
MPLLRAHMFAQGVEIYCAPTADDRDTWVASMQHVALEGPLFDQEALLVADLDMDEITRGKFDFDVGGHYLRPDVYPVCGPPYR